MLGRSSRFGFFGILGYRSLPRATVAYRRLHQIDLFLDEAACLLAEAGGFLAELVLFQFGPFGCRFGAAALAVYLRFAEFWQSAEQAGVGVEEHGVGERVFLERLLEDGRVKVVEEIAEVEGSDLCRG